MTTTTICCYYHHKYCFYHHIPIFHCVLSDPQNCTDLNVTCLVMVNVSSLFIVDNFTEGFCDNDNTCIMTCFETNVCDNSKYDESTCNGIDPSIKDLFIVNGKRCINCNNPVKRAKEEKKLTDVMPGLPKFTTNSTEPLDPAVAGQVMGAFDSTFVDQFNESTVALTLGESITGVLLKQTDPKHMEEVSFGYTRINESFSIVEERQALRGFSRSLTVSKEAFEKAMSSNTSEPFAAVFRFLNMSKDEYNSTVLGDEVLAVEMGTVIKNLTDTININFWNLNYKGKPDCFSWNGKGNRPNWSMDGCETIIVGGNITCRCTHMTFFAVLLTPLNETISSSTLNILTTITRAGCGISMFFLGIVLFMHFVMRRARSSNFTKILIQLVFAMFLLVFSFLVNDLVAKTKHAVGCTIMGALMHYFMLSTFTWFAVHAFHLCLQLYSGGKIQIQRYLLKVSIISWVIPGIITIVLLSVGKYGELTINTESVETSVSMCWILDNNVHYIVNIGYYAVVFLFTFSTFVLMLTWFYCVKQGQKVGAGQKNVSSCQKIITIMGLCCILGVTWSFAFFAYGDFRIPAYYCFTILNSFQGFCLFIYYYKTSRVEQNTDPDNSSSRTLKTNLDDIFNPYDNKGMKPKPE
ncbi:adhesion G-protein coupled receptor G5-like [Eucyclogobius newberryi]|uniref:adhesion G-protein coupled receptor G5-like n=1 Tax=Eucyclogobius newberryi TaxID=166745 RepID=UPI003B598BB9